MRKLLVFLTVLAIVLPCCTAYAGWKSVEDECITAIYSGIPWTDEDLCLNMIAKGTATSPVRFKCTFITYPEKQHRYPCCECSGQMWVPDLPTRVLGSSAKKWPAIHITFADPGTPVDYYKVVYLERTENYSKLGKVTVVRRGRDIRTLPDGRKFIFVRMPKPNTFYNVYFSAWNKWDEGTKDIFRVIKSGPPQK